MVEGLAPTFDICDRAAADLKRAAVMYMNETASQSFQPHSIMFSVTNNHRSTGIKVSSSDINSDVYGSDHNTVNHLLKVI